MRTESCFEKANICAQRHALHRVAWRLRDLPQQRSFGRPTLRRPCERLPGERWRAFAAAKVGIEDKTMSIKLSLAKISGSLDLSWRGLEEIPDEIFELEDLEVLTLAGNSIRALPAEISRFKSLKKLQVAGNQLTTLPPEITELTDLEEIWVHGNLLEALPENIGLLSKLWRLSMAGNRLARLPESCEKLTELRELNLSGNLVSELPAFVGNFEKLESLSLNGNRLESIPPEIGQCCALRLLSLQTNRLRRLPAEIAQLEAVEEFNISDNEITSMPGDWGDFRACKLMWLYGNRLKRLPRTILQLPKLECAWVESNPLEKDSLAEQLDDVIAGSGRLREVGLDTSQVEGMEVCKEPDRVWSRVRVGEVPASGIGYFKLRRAGITSNSRDDHLGSEVLVVTFASAPGTPNWGGVLNRIAADAKPIEKRFDVLYVCDGARNWYSAGDDGIEFWRQRLSNVTSRYEKVIMLGDSMGATGALLFSDLATLVQAFTPQVHLAEASIRPGQPREWLGRVRHRIAESVSNSRARVECHVGTWEHDLEQAKLLPEKCELVVHHVDSHRLAFALNQQGKLIPAVRTAILKELDLYQPPRLANLL